VPPTLCARGWESLATPSRDLTFSVAQAMPHRGFQGLDAVSCVASERTNTTRPGPIYTAHRLKNAARNSPERLRSLLLDLAVERITRFNLLGSSRATRAPSSQVVEDPPCQGLGHTILLAAPCFSDRTPEGARPAGRREIPFCDLCSRLIATSTHRSQDSRACRLRECDRRFVRRLMTRALTRAESGELAADAEMLLPARPAPGNAAIVRRGRQLRFVSSSLRRGCHAEWCAADRCALVRQRTSRTDVPLTFSVAPPRRSAEAGPRRGA